MSLEGFGSSIVEIRCQTLLELGRLTIGPLNIVSGIGIDPVLPHPGTDFIPLVSGYEALIRANPAW